MPELGVRDHAAGEGVELHFQGVGLYANRAPRAREGQSGAVYGLVWRERAGQAGPDERGFGIGQAVHW